MRLLARAPIILTSARQGRRRFRNNPLLAVRACRRRVIAHGYRSAVHESVVDLARIPESPGPSPGQYRAAVYDGPRRVWPD